MLQIVFHKNLFYYRKLTEASSSKFFEKTMGQMMTKQLQQNQSLIVKGLFKKSILSILNKLCLSEVKQIKISTHSYFKMLPFRGNFLRKLNDN